MPNISGFLATIYSTIHHEVHVHFENVSTMLNIWHGRKKGEQALIKTEEQRPPYIQLEKSAVGVMWVWSYCKIV